MKIVFVSDTHGDEDSLRRVVEFVKDYDAIIHTGDVLPYGVDYPCFISEYIKELDNIYFVRGNTDYFDGMSVMNKDNSYYDSIFNIGNYSIFATHGFIESMSRYECMAVENSCDILVYGHTHIKRLEKKDDLIILNPGSTSRPRDGIASFAILEDDVIRLYDLDRLRVIKKMLIL